MVRGPAWSRISSPMPTMATHTGRSELVKAAGTFYEWWTLTGQPRGSAGFRGSAGEVGLAARSLLNWPDGRARA